MRTDRRYGTYAVMAQLAALDLTVMWDTGKGATTAATTSRAILQTIANFVDSDNGWAAGNEAISAHCDGMSEKTIRRHLKRAEEVGIITRTRKQTGTFRARHRIQFELDLTQQQLVSNSAAHPHQPSTTPRRGSNPVDRTVADLEAELARVKALLGTAENRVAVTVTATHDSAESPVDNSTDEDSVAVTDDRFRSGHGRPLPKRTTHINQSSSSSSSERPAAEAASDNTEEEDSNAESVSGDLAAALRRVHPEIRLEPLMRRLAASGVDPAGVDLIAAATEIFETRRGQRIGDPTAYVATSISRESWRWPAGGPETWEQAIGATDASSAAVRPPAASAPPVAACSQGVHRWVSLADGRAFCGICTIDRDDAAIEFEHGSKDRVA